MTQKLFKKFRKEIMFSKKCSVFYVHYCPQFSKKDQNLSMFQSPFVQYFLDREETEEGLTD